MSKPPEENMIVIPDIGRDPEKMIIGYLNCSDIIPGLFDKYFRMKQTQPISKNVFITHQRQIKKTFLHHITKFELEFQDRSKYISDRVLLDNLFKYLLKKHAQDFSDIINETLPSSIKEKYSLISVDMHYGKYQKRDKMNKEFPKNAYIAFIETTKTMFDYCKRNRHSKPAEKIIFSQDIEPNYISENENLTHRPFPNNNPLCGYMYFDTKLNKYIYTLEIKYNAGSSIWNAIVIGKLTHVAENNYIIEHLTDNDKKDLQNMKTNINVKLI